MKLSLLNGKKIKNNLDKKNRSNWTNKFRALGKKKGSRKDFINLYKEMKKEKDKKNIKRSEVNDEASLKDLVETNE